MTKREIIVGTMLAGIMAGSLALNATTAHAKGKGGAKDAAKGGVTCKQANECKGHGECKTATNACAGKNSCKNHTFNAADEKACTAKGGTVEPKKS